MPKKLIVELTKEEQIILARNIDTDPQKLAELA